MVAGEVSVGYCINCNEPIPVIQDFTECKRCGTKTKPCAFNDDVDVRLNWRQICFIMAMAERMAIGNAELHTLVGHIALIIESQHPERGFVTSLTRAQTQEAKIKAEPKKIIRAGGN